MQPTHPLPPKRSRHRWHARQQHERVAGRPEASGREAVGASSCACVVAIDSAFRTAAPCSNVRPSARAGGGGEVGTDRRTASWSEHSRESGPRRSRSNPRRCFVARTWEGSVSPLVPHVYFNCHKLHNETKNLAGNVRGARIGEGSDATSVSSFAPVVDIWRPRLEQRRCKVN